MTLSVTPAAGTTAATSGTPGADSGPTAARCRDRTTPQRGRGVHDTLACVSYKVENKNNSLVFHPLSGHVMEVVEKKDSGRSPVAVLEFSVPNVLGLSCSLRYLDVLHPRVILL